MASDKVTEQQEAFARYYVKYGKGSTAYRKAYNVGAATKPEAIWVNASKLLADAKVALRVDFYRKLAQERWKSSVDKISEQLGIMAYLDKREIYDANGALKPPHEWPEHIARAVSGIEVYEECDALGTVIGHTKKVRFESRAAALAMLAKWKGMAIDRVEVGTPGEWDHLSDDEFEQKLAAKEAALNAIQKAQGKKEPKPVK